MQESEVRLLGNAVNRPVLWASAAMRPRLLRRCSRVVDIECRPMSCEIGGRIEILRGIIPMLPAKRPTVQYFIAVSGPYRGILCVLFNPLRS